MHDDVLRAVIGLEYQAALLAAAPLTTLAVGWVSRQLVAHLRDRRAAAYAARLVAWAEQAIPAKSARYAEVAALLSRRFPMLSGEQLEVLIESEVLGLKTALSGTVATANVSGAVTTARGAADTTPSGATATPPMTPASAITAASEAASATGDVAVATPVPALRVGV